MMIQTHTAKADSHTVVITDAAFESDAEIMNMIALDMGHDYSLVTGSSIKWHSLERATVTLFIG